MKPVSLVCVLFGLMTIGLLAAENTHAKKFIQVGWDSPNTAYLKDHWKEMEKGSPFDGVIYRVEAKGETNQQESSLLMWTKKPWKREWFQPVLADLKSCHFTQFSDNFLQMDATPGDLDWADESGWEAFAGKVGICSWLAKQSGSKGLCIDFESYGAKQFQWNAKGGRSFEEIQMLARKRGAVFMRAVAREFPDATLLAFWLNSANMKAGRQPDPHRILAGEAYGLLPAFINGMLDVMPSSIKLVDGCENGYYMDSETEFLRAASDMRGWDGAAMRLVAPENRGRYRTQVQVGFGFYLDMYLNEEGNQYYFPPLNGSRLARLQRNLNWARQVSDEYVWIYGEQCKWWNMETAWSKEAVARTVGRGRSWEQAMPGLTCTIDRVRDLTAAARREIGRQQTNNSLTNLIVNGDFSMITPQTGLPTGWSFWQDESSKGGFSWDGMVGTGAMKATNISNGVLIQKIQVTPGEVFVVEAECQRRGNPICLLGVRWQKQNDQWSNWDEDQVFVFKKSENKWEEAFGVVTVPEGAAQLVLMTGVRQQLTPEDVCWFDNVKAFRLSTVR